MAPTAPSGTPLVCGVNVPCSPALEYWTSTLDVCKKLPGKFKVTVLGKGGTTEYKDIPYIQFLNDTLIMFPHKDPDSLLEFIIASSYAIEILPHLLPQ
jgi:hypothetical protein